MQSWAGTISEDNGNVEISNGKWTNSATVAVATVTLTCIQYNDGGQALNTDTATLSGPNGPAPAQSTVTFDPFSVGPVVQGATKANCGITAATAAQ
jgi:glycerol-3-phosphate dehydrogenase